MSGQGLRPHRLVPRRVPQRHRLEPAQHLDRRVPARPHPRLDRRPGIVFGDMSPPGRRRGRIPECAARRSPMTVLVGTASWTDKTLIACGRFYPAGGEDGGGAAALLRLARSRWSRSTPATTRCRRRATAQLWAERTPAGFVMNVKAFRLFTGHQTEPHVLHKDLQLALAARSRRRFYYRDLPTELRDELWRRFRECARCRCRRPASSGMVHFQFPPWLLCNARRARARRALRASGWRATRSASSSATAPGSTARPRSADARLPARAGRRCTPSSTARRASPTACRRSGRRRTRDYALVRLHGRNRDTWNIKGASAASDRFNYDYPRRRAGGDRAADRASWR